MGIKVKTGDVFLVPVDQTTSVGGFVISNSNGELYVAVFHERMETADAARTNPKTIINGKPMMLALTLDAKLWNGDWKIIGNETGANTEFPQPAFKMQHKGKIYLESRDMKLRRPASANEEQILNYRTVSSPAVVESAAKAKFGIGQWNKYFDPLLADYAINTSKFFKVK
jgi:hypothetical protein